MSEKIDFNFGRGVYATKEDEICAQRDKEKIEEILERYPYRTDIDDIMLLLQNEKYKFESTLGRRFDDFIFDLSVENKLMTALEEEFTKQKKESQAKSFEKFKLFFLNEKYRLGIAVLCICACITSFGFYGLYEKYQSIAAEQYLDLAEIKNESKKSRLPVEKEVKVHLLSKETVVKTVMPEYVDLSEKNNDLIGWIKIDDTVIDYPVVQRADNEFYLNHNFNKENDGNGCIFLDMNCNAVENSDNMILYGHHMRTGNMFGSLNKYKNFDYYTKHKYIEFDTIYEKGKYEIMYVFQTKVLNADEISFKYYQFIDSVSDKEFDSAMNSMSKMAMYDTGVTASYGDKLLTLSTCDYQENKGRFVVVAKKVSD